MRDKPKIIGHRGAAALELENTLPSFKRAKELAVDAIELDIHVTRDGQFVVCHDPRMSRISDSDALVSELTHRQLEQIPLRNGHPIPLFEDVLAITGNIPIIIDLKIDTHLDSFCKLLDTYPDRDFTIVSFLPKAITGCKRLRPDIPAFIGRHYTPFSFINSVKRTGADGINLNFRLLNPVTYLAAQKQGLQIMAYTVNNAWAAKLIKRMYPGVWICTNHPDKFIKALRDKPL